MKNTSKYFVFMFCALCMFFCLGFSSNEPVAFTDIQGHWAEIEIQEWKGKGLISGCSDEHFCPDSAITRAEFITLINRLLGNFEGAQVNTAFTDVTELDWFVDEVYKAVAIGYIGGYPDGSFKPNQFISRQECAVILERVLASEKQNEKNDYNREENSLPEFADIIDIPDWSISAINMVVSNGYMNGYSDGSFKPANPLTRAEAVVVLDRTVRLNPEGETGSEIGATPVTTNKRKNKKPPVSPVTGVSLDIAELTLTAEGTVGVLTATVAPANATNRGIIWASSNEGVAGVVDGVVTPVAPGVAVITVTTEEGNFTANCQVTVNSVPIVDFACTDNSEITADFTWTLAEGAEQIKLQVSSDAGTTWIDADCTAIDPVITNTATVFGLAGGTTYRFKLVVSDGINAGESNLVEVLTSAASCDTYGASWTVAASTVLTRLDEAVGKNAGTDFDSIYPWSEMKLCNVADDGTINAYIGDDAFARDGSNGQVMVEIPKFYYKHTYEEGIHRFWIAEGPAEGFRLHPCFMRNFEEKDYVLVGANKAGLGKAEDDFTDALVSYSGYVPLTRKTRDEFRGLAQVRGMGWSQMDIQTRNALALLYLVEYADTNSQSVLGKGISQLRKTYDDIITRASTNDFTITVSQETAANYQIGEIIQAGSNLENHAICIDREIVNIETLEEDPTQAVITVDNEGPAFNSYVNYYINHVGQRTGGCDALAGDSGAAAGNDGKVSVCYRGIEDPWGNVYEFIDGVNIKNDEMQAYIAEDGFVDDVFAGSYKATGIILPSTNGNVRDFCMPMIPNTTEWLLMPNSIGGSASTYIPDYYYQKYIEDTEKIVLAGGSWARHEGLAGMFHWSVYYNSTYSSVEVGARLILLP